MNSSYDSARHVLVVYISGTPDGPSNERLIAEIDRLDRNGKERNQPTAMMMWLEQDTEPPNAHWRRRFAEQRKNLTAPRVFLSLVTLRAALRGVLTAMNWISPPPAHVKSQHHATFAESAAWLELCHGTPQAVLRRMLDEAQGKAP